MGLGDDTVLFNSGRSGGQYIINLGSGDDLIRVGSGGAGGLGDIDLTLGDGRDTIDLQDLPSDLTVSDFEVGASGDTLRLNIASSLTNWNGSDNPFTTGHIRLVQDGANTIVQVDTDGGGDSWATLLTLNNVTANDLTAENFNGFNPDGSPVGGPAVSWLDLSVKGDVIPVKGIGDDPVIESQITIANFKLAVADLFDMNEVSPPSEMTAFKRLTAESSADVQHIERAIELQPVEAPPVTWPGLVDNDFVVPVDDVEGWS